MRGTSATNGISAANGTSATNGSSAANGASVANGTSASNSTSAASGTSAANDTTSFSPGRMCRYRCKYFLTLNCQNWVYVNYSECFVCMVRISYFQHGCLAALMVTA